MIVRSSRKSLCISLQKLSRTSGNFNEARVRLEVSCVAHEYVHFYTILTFYCVNVSSNDHSAEIY